MPKVGHTPYQGKLFIKHAAHSLTDYKLMHRQLILQGLGLAPYSHNGRFQQWRTMKVVTFGLILQGLGMAPHPYNDRFHQ